MDTEVPISTMFIFVDRRKTGRGKSLPNRQKLLKRIKDSIKAAKPEDIDAGGVKGATAPSSKQNINPVKVARNALNEPNFHYARGTGNLEIVLPGNDQWLKGDEFPTESEGDDSASGQGGSGEDDFVINISRSEFYEVFFEDCELPDLEQTSMREMPEAVLEAAGFQKVGTPGQLSIIRTFKNSIGRRRALTLDAREELEVLQMRLDDLMEDGEERNMTQQSWDGETDIWVKEVQTVTERMTELKTKISAIPMFEKSDHRYRKTERVTVKSADATLIMAMDISGSMDETKKRLARKFFSMQYAFIKRKYPNTDLVFIYHTDEAAEVSEEEFFTSRANGGTTISPAIVLAHQIIKERYDAMQTNLYFSYAGDGDNWNDDNKEVMTALEDSGFLDKLRHMVYVQVGEEMLTWGGQQSGQQKFWTMMTSIASTSKKLHLAKIEHDSEVFTAFKEIYGKKQKKANA